MKSLSQESEYDIPVKKFYGTPTQSTFSRNFLKTDSTGGLQVPGGVQAIFNFTLGGIDIFTNREKLDYKRGADVLQGCGYFRSSFISEYTEGNSSNSGNCICAFIRNGTSATTNCKDALGSLSAITTTNTNSSGGSGNQQQTNLPIGASCTNNGECQSGFCASTGLCEAAPQTNLQNGASCTTNSECQSGICTNNICTATAPTNLANGAACNGNSECQSGICTNNVCTAPAPQTNLGIGAACNTSGQCTSGLCASTGLCAQPVACPPNAIVNKQYQANSDYGNVLANQIDNFSVLKTYNTINPSTIYEECTPLGVTCYGNVTSVNTTAANDNYAKTTYYRAAPNLILIISQSGSSSSIDCNGSGNGSCDELQIETTPYSTAIDNFSNQNCSSGSPNL
jgi:hypothetical protein